VQIGQRVIADNRPGAGGNLGLELASKAPADGYTMVISSPLVAISPLLYSKLNYDPFKDLAPVTRIGFSRKVLAVHPSVPARSLKELVALARKNPGKLNFSSGGVGTANHLAVELLKSVTGIDMVHVPYKGSGQGMAAMAGGEVDLSIASMAGVVALVGRIRPLVVLSETRGPLEGVPTAAEAGFPDMTDDTWYGMFVPAGTPRDVVLRLNQELHKALNNPELVKLLAASGIDTQTSTPEALAEFIKSENMRFAKVIRHAGIKPN
jgi:tripartite-type tricarboxylate transporter receptor subunit TctC